MPAIQIIIVEDEPIIAEDLSNQLIGEGFDIIKQFESGQEIIDYLKNEAAPDVILMDIQLYGPLDGIDTAQHISSKYHIPIIFLTSNTDKISFDRAKISTPHAFLSKPFRIFDVVHAIELACEKPQNEADESIEYMSDRIFIKSNNGLEKVLYEQILYFEADGAYTKLRTVSKEFMLSQTLKKTEANFIYRQFIKVHRSYIVNIKNVDRISDTSVILQNFKIPVSRSYRDELLKVFKTI